MEGLSGPQALGTWRFRRMTVAAALLVLLFALLLLSPAPGPVRLAVTGVGMIGGALVMAAGFRMRASQAGQAGPGPAAPARRRGGHRELPARPAPGHGPGPDDAGRGGSRRVRPVHPQRSRLYRPADR